MTGERLADGEIAAHPFQPGAYGRVPHSDDGGFDWYGCTPNGHLCNFRAHEVVEHEDDTITVSPSILVYGGKDGAEVWHGWLEHGVWRSV
jgi:hypothetical protein